MSCNSGSNYRSSTGNVNIEFFNFQQIIKYGKEIQIMSKFSKELALLYALLLQE